MYTVKRDKAREKKFMVLTNTGILYLSDGEPGPSKRHSCTACPLKAICGVL
ncbi:MAG: hypothetical protein QXO87_04555 [Desulfurococcaceae archaeon]